MFWELKIQEERKNENGTSWETVFSTRSREPFEITDETGRVTVIPNGVKLILWHDTCYDLNSLPPETLDVYKYAEKHWQEQFPGIEMLSSNAEVIEKYFQAVQDTVSFEIVEVQLKAWNDMQDVLSRF